MSPSNPAKPRTAPERTDAAAGRPADSARRAHFWQASRRLEERAAGLESVREEAGDRSGDDDAGPPKGRSFWPLRLRAT